MSSRESSRSLLLESYQGLSWWWCMFIVRTMSMVKRSSASSRRARQISVNAESIFSKPLNKRQKDVLARIAKRQAAGDDPVVDYSDIPVLSDEQLSRFRRTPRCWSRHDWTAMFTIGSRSMEMAIQPASTTSSVQ